MMSKCDTCGLPLLICNTLASYRKAIEHFARGDAIEGEAFAHMASEDYARYLTEYAGEVP